MKNLKHMKTFNESDEKLNISDVSDILKNIIKNVKKKSKNKSWMGANVHTSAFEEGKGCVIKILDDILKSYQ